MFGARFLGTLNLGGTFLCFLVLGRRVVWLLLVMMGVGMRRGDAFPYVMIVDDRVRSGKCTRLRSRRRWRGSDCGVL